MRAEALWPERRLCTVRGLGYAGHAENREQRLAGAAQAVVHLLVIAVGIDQLRGLEPREVGRDSGEAKAKSPGELRGGARHEKLLED